jgi:hypothetical protein
VHEHKHKVLTIMSVPSTMTSPLPGIYQKMANEFFDSGLNVDAIEVLLEWFDDGEKHDDGVPRPRLYVEFDNALPHNCCRYLALPLGSLEHQLEVAGSQFTNEVCGLLHPNAKVRRASTPVPSRGVLTFVAMQLFRNTPGIYHITLFHTSDPFDPRPAPLLPDGGTDATQAAHKRAAPTAADLALELQAMQQLVASSAAPTLVFERVLLATSGTLLMTWVDPQETVQKMRAAIWKRFPGSCKKQPNIIHTSLARVASPGQLTAELRKEVDALCRSWTERLKGQRLSCSDAWFIWEKQFTTAQGDKHVLPFKSQ